MKSLPEGDRDAHVGNARTRDVDAALATCLAPSEGPVGAVKMPGGASAVGTPASLPVPLETAAELGGLLGRQIAEIHVPILAGLVSLRIADGDRATEREAPDEARGRPIEEAASCHRSAVDRRQSAGLHPGLHRVQAVTGVAPR